jgi:hypothetical protein
MSDVEMVRTDDVLTHPAEPAGEAQRDHHGDV